jgi:hypothetical protein
MDKPLRLFAPFVCGTDISITPLLAPVENIGEKKSMKNIIIVSGLPRSGTSLMMQVLEAAGFPLFYDNHRQKDINNAAGYYELEAVKKITENAAFLAEAIGKGIKIVSHLLEYLPPLYDYKVIFMERHLREIIDSQNKMLLNSGKDVGHLSKMELEKFFFRHINSTKQWLNAQSNFDVHYISYNLLLSEPENQLQKIIKFLQLDVNVQNLKSCIRADFYRNRKKLSRR